MAYRIVAERRDETVRMDRSSVLVAVAKARVWASEGLESHRIIVRRRAIWMLHTAMRRLTAALIGYS